MKNITKEIHEKLREITGKSQIIGLTYTSKSSGERARYRVQVNVNYGACLERSKLELEILKPTLSGLDLEACEALEASIRKSLEANAKGEQSEDFTKRGIYAKIDGTPLQVNLNDGTFELSGLVLSKTIEVPGFFKTVNSKPLTIAKNKIEKTLPKGKWRTFTLDKEAFESARICGEEITAEKPAEKPEEKTKKTTHTRAQAHGLPIYGDEIYEE